MSGPPPVGAGRAVMGSSGDDEPPDTNRAASGGIHRRPDGARCVQGETGAPALPSTVSNRGLVRRDGRGIGLRAPSCQEGMRMQIEPEITFQIVEPDDPFDALEVGTGVQFVEEEVDGAVWALRFRDPLQRILEPLSAELGMSRKADKRSVAGRSLRKESQGMGIEVRAHSYATIAGEVPEAHEDVAEVVDTVAGAGVGRKLLWLPPCGCGRGEP